jgi:hypothetical protein
LCAQFTLQPSSLWLDLNETILNLTVQVEKTNIDVQSRAADDAARVASTSIGDDDVALSNFAAGAFVKQVLVHADNVLLFDSNDGFAFCNYMLNRLKMGDDNEYKELV